MTPTRLRIAAVMGAAAVALGAFGAHGLKDLVTPDRLATWETASRYHLLHAVVLLVLALAPAEPTTVQWARWPFRLILIGTLVFAATLYALVLLDQPMLGMITPIGGVLLISGWLAMLLPLPRAPEHGPS